MAKKIKVPVILQMEAVECGAASLTMILGYYKRFIPLEQIRVDCNVTRDGSTAKYIVKAALKHGLNAKGLKLSAEAVKKRTDFPMIIHWNFNHFVVLCGFEKDMAIINDPAEGRVKIDWDTFKKSFTGITLCFSKTEAFEPFGKPKSSMEYIKNRLDGMGATISFVVVLGIIYSVFQMLPPVFYKIFTDKILLVQSSEWMKPLILAMTAVAVSGLLVGSLKNIVFAKMKAKFRIRSASGFVWKVLRLPAQFYSQRFSGDIVSRANNCDEITNLLFERFIPAVMDTIFLMGVLVLLIIMDPIIGSVVLVTGILQVIVILISSSGNENISRSIGRDYGKMSGMMLSGISMVETVKASGAETGIVEKILGYQTKYNNSSLVLTKNKLRLHILPQLFEGLCNTIVLIIGIYAIFEGKQTVGMLVAMQSFVLMFFSPLSWLTQCVQAFREISGSVDRVQDIMEFEESKTEKALFSANDWDRESLSGEVQLKDVSFGYSPVTEPLIREFNLSAKPGDMIAISGGSGSGKSTLTKLLCGLYPVNSGEITFDGKKIEEIDHYVFSNSVAVVDQNISLFAGTIRDNITMWDDDIDEKTIVEACKDACIHDDIMLRKEGYDYEIKEGGSNFSGGQRQRIEIARAFASNPSILILDEATAALDVITEKKIMDAVKRRNITCFIVAHRLSTIRDADEIIMLKDGIICERGTHSELMDLDGDYAALVRND